MRNPSSTTVLHGTFTIGDASSVPVPSYPRTSTAFTPRFPVGGTRLRLFHPRHTSRESFGTVPAQILYGASYDKFPYGRCIVGVLLMGAFAPFRYDEDYAKSMTWRNYVLVGPMSQWPLVRAVYVHLVMWVLARKLSTVDHAKAFLHAVVFDKMDEAERQVYARWRAREGIAEGEIETRFATNSARSVATCWEGFKRTSSVLYADWGFRPDGLDEAHSRPCVLFVTNTGDREAPQAWTEYLAACYKNAKVKTIDGGRLGTLFYMDEVWGEFLAEIE